MKRLKVDDMTEDQKTCYEVLVKTFGGDFRVPLVVFAHDLCCRAEIVQSGPGRVGILVTKCKGREGEIHEIHPELEDHIAAIRGRDS